MKQFRKTAVLAQRTLKEMLRDPLTLFFGLAFPILILLLLMFIGFFMQTSQALVVLAPILLPVAQAIGIDPVHFGLIMVVTLTFGGCTPPVGSMLFVVNSITKMGFARLTKAMLPLYIPLVLSILLITFLPQLSLFLPNLVFG